MARPSGEKTRCSGKWTEAKFTSFVKGNLRRATIKWSPIGECLSNARTRRGFYRCNACKEEVPATIKEGRKRVKNAIVDHIEPIVPVTGWVSWDDCIEKMFCELDNLQCLCRKCHDEKSNEEKKLRAMHRKNNT